MAFVIYRRTRVEGSPPRLLLVGGDGRWIRPLLRLIEKLGFSAMWVEPGQGEPSRMESQDLILTADAEVDWVLERQISGDPVPIVVMTGSLLGLSTPLSEEASALPFPVTRESLERALAVLDDPLRRGIAEGPRNR